HPPTSTLFPYTTLFRSFIEQFSKAGFLEEEHEGLRVVRVEELMNRWLAANQRSVPEMGVRWVLRGRENALRDAVRSYVRSEERKDRKSTRLNSSHQIIS